MPTYAEIEELANKCAWKWIERIDDEGRLIKGFEITGPTKNSIFIPKGDYNEEKWTDGAAYLSSDIHGTEPRGLFLDNNRQTFFSGGRGSGMQIRAVSY